MPKELMAVFSKRAAAIDVALAAKLDEFRQREGRDPSPRERAAMTREAAADTRGRKSGHGAADLATRWQREAADAGWTVEQLVAEIDDGCPQPRASRAGDGRRGRGGGVGAALVVGTARRDAGDL